MQQSFIMTRLRVIVLSLCLAAIPASTGVYVPYVKPAPGVVSMQAAPTQIFPPHRDSLTHIQPGHDNDLTLNCSTVPKFMSGLTIVSLIVQKEDIGEIVSITARQVDMPDVKTGRMLTHLTGQVTAAGHIEANDVNAFLSVTIKNAGENAVGVYQCIFLGYDFGGHPVSYEAKAEVAEGRPAIRLPLDLTSLPTFKNHYYYLSKADNRTSHDSANSECHQIGGYLAEINDEDEYKFVQSTLDSMYAKPTYPGHVWKRSYSQLANMYPPDPWKCHGGRVRLGAKYDTKADNWISMTSHINLTLYVEPPYTPNNESVQLCLYSAYFSKNSWPNLNQHPETYEWNLAMGHCEAGGAWDRFRFTIFEGPPMFVCEIPGHAQSIVG